MSTPTLCKKTCLAKDNGDKKVEDAVSGKKQNHKQAAVTNLPSSLVAADVVRTEQFGSVSSRTTKENPENCPGCNAQK